MPAVPATASLLPSSPRQTAVAEQTAPVVEQAAPVAEQSVACGAARSRAEQPSPAAGPAAPVPAKVHPRGRPSTVPAVNLSWREADSLEMGVPSVEDSDDAIVLEPPSQLVADTRRRSGPRRHTEDLGPEGDGTPSGEAPAEPSELAPDADESPATRAAARAAARDTETRKVRLRRVLVLVAVVLVLAVVGWFVLGGGSDTAAPHGPGSGSSAVAGAAPAPALVTRA